MSEAADVIRAQQADPAAPPMRETLAEALQQLADAEAADVDVTGAQTGAKAVDVISELMAQHVAAQTAPGPLPKPAAAQRSEEQEQHDVGLRATEAVDRILSIPLVEPVAPASIAVARRKDLEIAEPAAELTMMPDIEAPLAAVSAEVQAPAGPPAPLRQPEDDIGHSVPLDAEDLAFLLSPASRTRPSEKQPAAAGASAPQAAARPPALPLPPMLAQSPADAETAVQKPFLKKLIAEQQSAPTRASVLQPPEPFMVAPGAAAEPAAAADVPESTESEETARKPRLARLLKAWSRH
jgi:hypothetical protein